MLLPRGCSAELAMVEKSAPETELKKSNSPPPHHLSRRIAANFTRGEIGITILWMFVFIARRGPSFSDRTSAQGALDRPLVNSGVSPAIDHLKNQLLAKKEALGFLV